MTLSTTPGFFWLPGRLPPDEAQAEECPGYSADIIQSTRNQVSKAQIGILPMPEVNSAASAWFRVSPKNWSAADQGQRDLPRKLLRGTLWSDPDRVVCPVSESRKNRRRGEH